jgi:ribose 5-phosphate isomerase A
MTADLWKQQAAEHALQLVEHGMVLGLGTGSTAAKFVAALGARVAQGLQVTGVPTSEATRALAEQVGIPLTTLDDRPMLDLTIDGADEIDLDLRLIKGGGGALLREKIVGMASERLVVIADSSKLVDTLGAYSLPLEVVRFGLAATRAMIEQVAAEAGCTGEVRLRMGPGGQPFLTDCGNWLVDCAFGSIPDPEALDELLHMVPGIVETGLFLGLADAALVAGADGLRLLERDEGEERE